MFFIQKLLEQSMRLENSRKLAIRIVWKLLGIIPVFCSRYLGKKADKRKVESCKKVEKSAAVYKEKAQKKK